MKNGYGPNIYLVPETAFNVISTLGHIDRMSLCPCLYSYPLAFWCLFQMVNCHAQTFLIDRKVRDSAILQLRY